jgi:hypothetical protein
MREASRYSLERLSLFCHIGGVITVFLGILVVLMDLLDGDFRHIQVGIFICVTGYVFVKISLRIEQILFKEK